ncbi:MAG: glycine--tRNA ligase subunit beta [Candidatus Bipolaricaulota bacterium]
MPVLLLEIGVEDMPALDIPCLAQELHTTTSKVFTQEALSYRQIDVYYTPRRLAMLVRDLKTQQEERVKSIKGPPTAVAFDSKGCATQAGIGFAQSQGVTVAELGQVEYGAKIYTSVQRSIPGKETSEVLLAVLPRIIMDLHPKKTMRWDSSGLSFLRPLRWLVCLYDDKLIPIELGHLRAGKKTYGHRFLEQEEVVLDGATSYVQTLADSSVVVDPAVRQTMVLDALREQADRLGADYLIDDELLCRIVNGTEHPTPIFGSIPEEFLNLPTEIVHATLREEGKFVPFVLADGTSPCFMGFRDGMPDKRGIVRAGYERVVQARLRDSRFFFDRDRQSTLAEKVRDLHNMVYDARLGSLWEKVERIRALAGAIADHTGDGLSQEVDRAAFLCKADLVTELVQAFPELQGIAGGLYARLDDESNAVADAISEHYFPISSEASLPKSRVGTIVSLADKLDTVIGAVLVGEQPTGSRDPYGIRRQANSLIRLAIEGKVDLDFFELIESLEETYLVIERKGAISDVRQFISERVAQLLRQKYGIGPDVVACVAAVRGGNFYHIFLRARALTTWHESKDFHSLIAAFSRVCNITKNSAETDFNPSLFTSEAEKALWREYLKVEGSLTNLLEEGNYEQGIKLLLSLRDPINCYFEDVLVMAEEVSIRQNRLGFLSALAGLFYRIGDLSKVVTTGDSRETNPASAQEER